LANKKCTGVPEKIAFAFRLPNVVHVLFYFNSYCFCQILSQSFTQAVLFFLLIINKNFSFDVTEEKDQLGLNHLEAKGIMIFSNKYIILYYCG